jgi:hypothetical protein
MSDERKKLKLEALTARVYGFHCGRLIKAAERRAGMRSIGALLVSWPNLSPALKDVWMETVVKALEYAAETYGDDEDPMEATHK